MAQNFLSVAESINFCKPIDLDKWDEWERHVGNWQLGGDVSQVSIPVESQNEPSTALQSDLFAGADVFLAGRCTAFQKRPGSAPLPRRRQSSAASSTAAPTVHLQPSIAASGLDVSKQESAHQLLQESLIQSNTKELRLRLKALGKNSKASSVPRAKMPLRPDPSLPANLTPRSVLALEASLSQGSLRCKRLQALLHRRPGGKDDTSLDEQIAQAQSLRDLLSQISGSLMLGKAAETELHQFHKELHKTKIALNKQERCQQALAAKNAELKETNFIARVQTGLGKTSTGGHQHKSLTRLESCSKAKPRKRESNDARELKLKKALEHLEGCAGEVAERACTMVDHRRRKTEKGTATQKGCGAYTGKCRQTATAEGLQHTLLELLRQRERVSQYRDDSISMEREMSKRVEALHSELNSVEL